MLEEFSGIPVKALLENDEKTTELDLGGKCCGVTGACVLAECLKVIFFLFFSVGHIPGIFFCVIALGNTDSWSFPGILRLTGQRNAAAD